MANPPRKPTGTTGPLHVSAEEAEFLQLEFPSTKEEIEEFIVEAFVRNSDSMPLRISEWKQNHQNDFDFSVVTTEGPKFLELMEIAPLENLRGSYDKHPVRIGRTILQNISWPRSTENLRGIAEPPLRVSASCCMLLIGNLP